MILYWRVLLGDLVLIQGLRMKKVGRSRIKKLKWIFENFVTFQFPPQMYFLCSICQSHSWNKQNQNKHMNKYSHNKSQHPKQAKTMKLKPLTHFSSADRESAKTNRNRVRPQCCSSPPKPHSLTLSFSTKCWLLSKYKEQI